MAVKEVKKILGIRKVNAEKVMELKRTSLLLMKNPSEEAQARGNILKECLEELGIWQDEEMKYPVEIDTMSTHVRRSTLAMLLCRAFFLIGHQMSWYSLVKKNWRILYYCGGILVVEDDNGVIRELLTDDLRIFYSVQIKDKVLFSPAFMSLTLPYEEGGY